MGEVTSMRLPADSGYVEVEFQSWWNALDPEERVEFQLTYGGKAQEAKFLYLLDKWMFSGGRWGEPDFGMIVEAYAIAYNVPIATARAHYKEALDHDAVKSIISRLTYRETLSSAMRVQQQRSRVVEGLFKELRQKATAEDGSTDYASHIPLAKLALQSAASLSSEANEREAQERAERTRTAMQRAREVAAKSGEHREISRDEVIVMLRDLRDKLGREPFEQLVRDTGISELDSGGRALPP